MSGAASQLIIAWVQAITFALLGPLQLFFGQAGETFVNFVQAGLSSGWFEVIAAFKSITMDNMFVCLNLLIMWISGTLALGMASTTSKKLKQTMKGMLLFYLLADIPMAFISEIIFKEYAGCTGIGDPTLEFPKGIPTGPADSNCFDDKAEFIQALWIQKCVVWGNTIIGGVVANILATVIQPWSMAMSGATMTVKAVTETTMVIGVNYLDWTQEKVQEIGFMFAGLEFGLIYGLAGLGFLFQISSAFYVKAVKDGQPPPEITGIRKILLCGPMLFLLRMLLKCDVFLKTRLLSPSQLTARISNSFVEKVSSPAAKDSSSDKGLEAAKEADPAPSAPTMDPALYELLVEAHKDKPEVIKGLSVYAPKPAPAPELPGSVPTKDDLPPGPELRSESIEGA